jgi:hypothetical protein
MGSAMKKPMTKEERKREKKEALGETFEGGVAIVAYYSFSARWLVSKFARNFDSESIYKKHIHFVYTLCIHS